MKIEIGTWYKLVKKDTFDNAAQQNSKISEYLTTPFCVNNTKYSGCYCSNNISFNSLEIQKRYDEAREDYNYGHLFDDSDLARGIFVKIDAGELVATEHDDMFVFQALKELHWHNGLVYYNKADVGSRPGIVFKDYDELVRIALTHKLDNDFIKKASELKAEYETKVEELCKEYNRGLNLILISAGVSSKKRT